MRQWVEILMLIADMQPGDIDKLSKEEADKVRLVVDSIELNHTLCLDAADHELLDKALDKLAPTKH